MAFARGSIAEPGELAYGFAKYLRDALPNASFIGFTGTPIEKDDVDTPAVFGDYVDVYDISRAVEDGATVPRISTRAGWPASSCRRGTAGHRCRDRRPDRGRGDQRAGAAEAALVRGGEAGRIEEAAGNGRRRPRRASGGPAGRDGRQGDDRLHEPPHLPWRSMRRSSRCGPNGIARTTRRGR
ncbi:hypothetical protein AB5I41_16565 [Sphingomonas sp. MMS24-JH45]